MNFTLFNWPEFSKFLRGCDKCYKQLFCDQNLIIFTVKEKRKRVLCTEFGLKWIIDPCDDFVGKCKLGDSAICTGENRADEYGQCIFSSLFYLLTGSESSK